MSKKESVLLASTCFFGGMVAGFLLAPIKGGFSCGNYSGNNNIGNIQKLTQDETEETK